MAKTLPFYVYRILGEYGETVYIGKGCGRRLHNQMRRFASSGEVLERFSTDKKAFKRERELIAEHNPPLNKSPGGNGGTMGMKSSGLTPLYAGLSTLIRRLDGLDEPVKAFLSGMIGEIARKEGQSKFAAGLRQYNIDVSYV